MVFEFIVKLVYEMCFYVLRFGIFIYLVQMHLYYLLLSFGIYFVYRIKSIVTSLFVYFIILSFIRIRRIEHFLTLPSCDLVLHL